MSGVNADLRAGVVEELERVLIGQTIKLVRSPDQGEIVLKTDSGVEIWFRGVRNVDTSDAPLIIVQIKTDEVMGV